MEPTTPISIERGLSVRAAAEEAPDRPAILSEDATISFTELARRVDAVAAALEGHEAVAVVASLRVETLVVMYAAIERGTTLVLIHPRATTEERDALVRRSGASIVVDEAWRGEAHRAASRVSPPPAATRTMAVVFTSGTSGEPKGVMLSRRALVAAARASEANLGWTSDDRWVLCMPLAHVGGFSVLVRCLLARRTIVLAPWTGSPKPLLASIERHRATLLSVVPTMLRAIFEATPGERLPGSLRAVLVGGDATPPDLLVEGARRGAPLLTTYGMSEACAQVATLAPGEPALDAGVGRPLSGIEVRIVEGEIAVRGPTLFDGYLGESKAPFDGEGWFRTGDLGRLDALGRLHVTGRATDRIVTGGENVDPLEVEQVLALHPSVATACVFGRPDARWGEIVCAAIVPRIPVVSDEDLASLDAFARARLGSFKRPRAYAVCHELVVGRTGKLDRRGTGRRVDGRLRVVKRA